jgi:hypothetical protein
LYGERGLHFCVSLRYSQVLELNTFSTEREWFKRCQWQLRQHGCSKALPFVRVQRHSPASAAQKNSAQLGGA